MAQQTGEQHVDSYVDDYESADSEDEFDDTQYGTMVSSSAAFFTCPAAPLHRLQLHQCVDRVTRAVKLIVHSTML